MKQSEILTSIKNYIDFMSIAEKRKPRVPYSSGVLYVFWVYPDKNA